MSYTVPSANEVEIMRAQSRITKWTQIETWGHTERVRQWAAKRTATARTDLQKLQRKDANP